VHKRYVDLIEANIIDPTKVPRISLENAVSIASVVLVTEATSTETAAEKRARMAEPELDQWASLRSRARRLQRSSKQCHRRCCLHSNRCWPWLQHI
jgi:hypothetical protein